jgi:5'-deoxynucleotidase YfbR-like HD superfamily hydrolase
MQAGAERGANSAVNSFLTASGKSFLLLDPKPQDIDFDVIGEALAKQCRFNGHTSQFYSIAQHSMLVAACLPPEMRLYGLLHDAHEAFTGSLTAPLKHALAQSGDALAEITAAIEAAIFEAAGLQWPLPADVDTALQRADRVVLATELRDLMPETELDFGKLPPPLSKIIRPMPWASAMEAFHLRRREYAKWHPSSRC